MTDKEYIKHFAELVHNNTWPCEGGWVYDYDLVTTDQLLDIYYTYMAENNTKDPSSL